MVSNVVRMIRNGFVSNVSPNDRYSSGSDCTQQTQDICMTFMQCRPNVFDAGPTLHKVIQMFCVYWVGNAYLDRTVCIAMDIVYFIWATVYDWKAYVNTIKAYVRYREFIRKVWLIRHGYVMMREYFRKVRQRFGFQSASTYISSTPNRHEWLIWRENVEICVWFGGFAWLYPSHTYTTHSPRLQ